MLTTQSTVVSALTVFLPRIYSTDDSDTTPPKHIAQRLLGHLFIILVPSGIDFKQGNYILILKSTRE